MGPRIWARVSDAEGHIVAQSVSECRPGAGPAELDRLMEAAARAIGRGVADWARIDVSLVPDSNSIERTTT